tara:strand:+ start:3065 stop:3967 length:903 start_codon:yes stop_codon:yes gene_type:complete
MRLYDCSLYYDENLILNTRLNILNKYFDKFIICESKYSHSGRKKKLNFNINNFPEFKDKIIYVVSDKEPNELIYKSKDGKKIESPEDYRYNAIKRIAFQRNTLMSTVNEIADPNDFIFYSDNDEIPNMESFDQIKETNDIVIFKQKLFYYKFNLLFERLNWYGTKAVKKKKLINFEWLRQVKPKKYSFYRLDTLFKKDKYIRLKIINNGGWHFTRIISPDEIHKKELDAEHHDEYRASNKNPQKIKDLIERRVIDHDHVADSKKSKYGSEFKLKVISLDELPEFIKLNWKKYEQFLDLRP